MEPIQNERSAGSERLKWIRGLLFLNGVIWLLFSLNFIISPGHAYGLSESSVWILAVMMAVNGMVLIALGWLVVRVKAWLLRASFGYVLINGILSITDQSGIFDYLVLFLNLVLLILLVREMRAASRENRGDH